MQISIPIITASSWSNNGASGGAIGWGTASQGGRFRFRVPFQVGSRSVMSTKGKVRPARRANPVVPIVPDVKARIEVQHTCLNRVFRTCYWKVYIYMYIYIYIYIQFRGVHVRLSELNSTFNFQVGLWWSVECITRFIPFSTPIIPPL